MVRKALSALVAILLLCGLSKASDRGILRFIYCSDLHYGLEREFRGTSDVPADSVCRAMIQSFGLLKNTVLPDDGGAGGGSAFGNPDFIVCTGDIANRMEHGIQSASESWKQFRNDWAEFADRLYIVPGNHDISNAIGYTRPMKPEHDASSAAGIYNMMMHPDTDVTPEGFDYRKDKTHYTFVMDSIRFVFMGMWPDSCMREWYTNTIDAGDSIPVLLFTHDPPDADAKHFTDPVSPHGINSADRFENLLADTCSVSSIDSLPLDNWRTLERFIAAHPEIKAYFHGDCNYNEFYTWHGADSTVSLPVIRVDSPMKGELSADNETLLSYVIVVIDTSTGLLTARECLWNTDNGHSIRWGASATNSLLPSHPQSSLRNQRHAKK